MAVILRTQAIVGGSALPGLGISTLYWTPGSVGGSTADATDCLARFRTVFDSFKAFITTGITFQFDTTVLAIEATTGTLVTTFNAAVALSVTGTAAGDVLPKQTQGLLKWSSASVIAGRRVRGRLFMPGPIETDNTISGVPSGTYTSTLTTSGGSVLTPGATASTACIWHRPGPAGAGASAQITGAAASGIWSVLRSRRA